MASGHLRGTHRPAASGWSRLMFTYLVARRPSCGCRSGQTQPLPGLQRWCNWTAWAKHFVSSCWEKLDWYRFRRWTQLPSATHILCCNSPESSQTLGRWRSASERARTATCRPSAQPRWRRSARQTQGWLGGSSLASHDPASTAALSIRIALCYTDLVRKSRRLILLFARECRLQFDIRDWISSEG